MTDQRCGTCGRGFYRGDIICCGAPFNDGTIGVNAIWAERKYNPMRMFALARAMAATKAGAASPAVADKVFEEPEGSDCNNMDPNDGATCKMWEAHPELAGDREHWRDSTVMGSQYEEQISDSGKHRHRPLRFVTGPGEYGMEQGIGDWRPGGIGDWRPGAAPDRTCIDL